MFLISEVPLNEAGPSRHSRFRSAAAERVEENLQGYLAHKNPLPLRTLQ